MRNLRHLAAALALVIATATGAQADALDDIQHRGTLVVGVKKDVPLWGMADPVTGVPAGLEPDLAADLAARLGAKLKLVGVLTADRQDLLEQRQVDLLIATLAVTPERRERMTLVQPHYYASGANVLVRRDAAFRAWGELRNRRVCGRRGSFYNRSITLAYGLDVVPLYSSRLAMEALRDGRCDAVLYDDTTIIAMLQDPQWARQFGMPLPSLHPTPWAIALHRSEQGGRLERVVAQAVAQWHRGGRIMDLERKWGIPLSSDSRRMNELWNRRGKSGWFCGELAGGATPAECM